MSNVSSDVIPVPAAIVDTLADAGVRSVFGMPGGKTGAIYDALFDRPDIRTVLTREEGVATIMAETLGRISGHVGVAMGQTSWLLGKGGMGILEAHLGSSPVVLLGDLTDFAPFSHHGPYQAATGHYGTWDAASALRGLTKQVFVAYDPVEAVQSTQLAFKHATSGEPGPVAVLFHSRALTGVVGPTSKPRIRPTTELLPDTLSVPPQERIRKVVEPLRQAARPVIVVGNGARRGTTPREIVRLAELTGARIATTAGGKGVVGERHPLAVGVMGNHGNPVANATVAEADVVLAVATKLGPLDTCFGNPTVLGPHQHIVQIDIEPRNVAWTVPVKDALIGDASQTLAALVEHVAALELPVAPPPTESAFSRPHGASDNVPIHPQRVITALLEAVDDDCVVTCDAGENRLFVNRYFQALRSGGLIQPAAAGGMGYAVPSALAVRVDDPDVVPIAVCGDGGFGMSLPALVTSVEESLPIVVVVLNNRALGWVQGNQQERRIASTLGDFDLAAVATGLGCHGVRVDDPADLGAAIAKALATVRETSTTVVIDVRCSREEEHTDIASTLNNWD